MSGELGKWEFEGGRSPSLYSPGMIVSDGLLDGRSMCEKLEEKISIDIP